MIKPFLTAAVVIAAFPLGGCLMSGSGLYGNDEFPRYAQRADVITLSAGDAKEVNRITQTNHPWPRYVSNRNIPMQGPKAVRAMECYRQGRGQEQIGQGPTQQIAINTGQGGGASAAGGQNTQLKCN